MCERSEDELLGNQAISSINLKKFHSQGGSAFALYPGADVSGTVRFIVSFQTISDYLDNLCDRSGIQDEKAFRQLHLSMLDAVDPQRAICDYYLYYPYKDDNNYLRQLVEECRLQISTLPGYSHVADRIKQYVRLYSDLQSLKHLPQNTREKKLLKWAEKYIGKYPAISPWEFSAACGSTLGIFAMFAAAHRHDLSPGEVKQMDSVYFPWICGLHILLDYYIDAYEDMQTGDLNFTYFYKNLKFCEERLSYFLKESLRRCLDLRYPDFHITILKGLLAMYLSDPKASLGLNRLTSRNILKASGRETIRYYNICRFLRLAGIL